MAMISFRKLATSLYTLIAAPEKLQRKNIKNPVFNISCGRTGGVEWKTEILSNYEPFMGNLK